MDQMFGSAAGFKHVSLRRFKQEMQLYSLSHLQKNKRTGIICISGRAGPLNFL